MSVTFYRKYRSQTFETMQGQGHIVQTLTNAIMHDRLSHAYIFSGPRGTGKTSAARILAKHSGLFIRPRPASDILARVSKLGFFPN